MLTRNKFLTDFELKCYNFAENIAVYYVLNFETTLGITFNELNRVSNELSRYFLKNLKESTRYIGVSLTDSFLLPCLVLGIWKSGWGFAGAGSQYTLKNTLHYLNFLKVKYLITDSVDDKYGGEIISSFAVHQQNFYIWRRKTEEDRSSGVGFFCYGIMTSGSTGSSKIIQVPWSCILLNVDELSNGFDIKESDCIFQASPYTFDPFFIELFLSLLNGCSLMIVSDFIKLNSSSLVRILFNEDTSVMSPYSNCSHSEGDNNFFIDVKYVRRKTATVLQMTPSIFKRWSDREIKETILSPKTSLRLLILGGEKFPKEILNLKSSDNKTRIFNIYGITEISCWAFINEITNQSPDIEVSLGRTLNDISFKISEDNELYIGSKNRVCLVDEENEFLVDKPVFRNTGDIVRLTNDKLYYVMRSNQIVKKFGIKINLNEVEKAHLECNKLIKECCCIYDDVHFKLGLFYVSNCVKNSEQETILTEPKNLVKDGCQVSRGELNDIEIPDYLIPISQIPLNSHGKVDRERLLHHVRDLYNIKPPCTDLRKVFEKIICDTLGLKQVGSHSTSILQLGLTSVLALQIINKLENVGVKTSQNFLRELLKGGNVESCLKCLNLEEEISGVARKKIKIEGEEVMDVIEDVMVSVRWKFDLGKCVDATPSVFTSQGIEMIVVGSHSSRLSCLDVDSGREIWSICLGDRIESGLAITKDGIKGFVGCYDHFVYCVTLLDGSVLWKYQTDEMVKSTPCLSSDEQTVYVGSYDKCLHCLSASDGQLIKKLKLSEGGIFSSGLVSNSLNTFYTGTLDGTCVALSQKDNQIIWKLKLETPIFASPCLTSEEKILFAEVLGVVHCFNALSGTKVWAYKAGGNIYSSPVAQRSANSTLIVFGCHDAHVYCLRDGGTPELEWKRQLKSSVFARPSVFVLESAPDNWMVCAATTKGFIYLCDFISGSLKTESKLSGEVFSSPVFSRNRLFVGCRDNYVYSLDVRLINED